MHPSQSNSDGTDNRGNGWPLSGGAAWRIAAGYLLFGGFWIVATDWLLPLLVADPGWWQTVKGLVFVAASAGLIYGLVRREITRRTDAEQQLRRSDEKYRALFKNNATGAFRAAPDGTLLEANAALADLLGAGSAEALTGRPLADLFAHPEAYDTWREAIRAEGAVTNLEAELTRTGEESVWALIHSVWVEVDRREAFISGTVADVTAQKEARERLEGYAYRDPLTELPNRRYLEEQAETSLAHARRHDERVALLYLDLTWFKRVNDTLGHQAGDEVLIQLGERLKRVVRDEDVLSRVGGDEFAFLLHDMAGVEEARRAAGRLREAIDRPFEVEGRTVRIRGKFGIALFPDHAETFSSLLAAADDAMYRAADAEETIQVARTKPDTEPTDLLAREETVRRAVEDERLELHLQPICRVRTGEVVGAEALCRLRDADGDLVPPADFIPVAERTGLVARIDEWMVRAAADLLPTACGELGLDWIGVNFSARSLAREDFCERVAEVVPPPGELDGRLVAEVTESVAIRDPERGAEVFRRLKDCGLRVAIDDFGTGESAIAYLKQLRADMVKVDMIFVRGIEESDEDEELLRAISNLCKTLDASVVIEGVETADQRSKLEGCNLDFAQGFYFGRPIPAETFLQRCRSEAMFEAAEELGPAVGEPTSHSPDPGDGP